MAHGVQARSGLGTPLGEFFPTGMFGRMFPALPALKASEDQLFQLAAAMLSSVGDDNDGTGDNPNIPAGFTYLGQFIDHDITLDLTSIGETRVDPLAVHNFRTPGLDLDCMYGLGPSIQPYMYESSGEKFLIGLTSPNRPGGDPSVAVSLPFDLPRGPNNRALIGDPRNDENLVVAQTHLAFMRFHNKVVDGLKAGTIQPLEFGKPSLFESARQLVIWHYHWIVMNDFVRRLVQPAVLDDVLQNGRKFFRFEEEPFMPVEFSGAAYRLGHSMVRAEYDYNRVFTPKPGGVVPASLQLLFTFSGGSGGGVPIPSDWIIDWRRFFEIDSALTPNASRKLDPSVIRALGDLPEFASVPDIRLRSLSFRNLLRGLRLNLPSGQAVARLMGLTPLPEADIAKGIAGAAAAANGFGKESPLWFYILKEAEVQESGLRLGQVGSRILSEVFVGLIQGDPASFMNVFPKWKPTLPSAMVGNFTMVDLLNIAGDVNPIG